MGGKLYLENLSATLALPLSSIPTRPTEFTVTESGLLIHLQSPQGAHGERSPGFGNFLLPILQVITTMAPSHPSMMGEFPPSALDLLTEKPVQNDALCLGICSKRSPRAIQTVIFHPVLSPKKKAIPRARRNSKMEIICLVIF